MRSVWPSREFLLAIAIAAVGVAAVGPATGFAGEVVMLDGTRLPGEVPIYLATVGPKAPRPDRENTPNLAIISLAEGNAIRFYVSRLQVRSLNRDADLRPTELFQLPEEKRPKPSRVEQVAGLLEATSWDAFGHRRVTFRDGDKKRDLMQEIVELGPKYSKVTAMDFQWEFGIATRTIPPDALDAILHKATKSDNADDRFAIVRFYLEGEFYGLAQKELDSIKTDFPDRAKQVSALSAQLTQYLADEAVNILEDRREAGQYELAYQTARRFLTLELPEVSPATLQTLEDSVATHERQRMHIEELRQTLGELQAQLKPDQAAEVAPLRLAIAAGLHPATLDRLAPFDAAMTAENRSPEEKLALALTGWIVGPAFADTDLKNAIRLWQARGLMIEYLRAETTVDRQALLEQLLTVESVGPQQVLRMIPLLPPTIDTREIQPGIPQTIELPVQSKDEVPGSYVTLLPPEYHATRSYPMIVALHAEGMQPEHEVKWWARLAQQRGYIVIAPNYLSGNQRGYDYRVESHQAVLNALLDARRRFHVDSDRVFLAGHGAGGDATFDIGYSHPHLFAGIMPITAMCEKFSRLYWENARHLPQFILAGELDRTAPEVNARIIDQMLVKQFPVIYAVMTGRGHEDFWTEDARLFDWMSRQKRPRPPLEFTVKTARTSDNEFWWWKFTNFPERFGMTGWPSSDHLTSKNLVLTITARRAKGANVLNLQSGARYHGVWLFPDVVSFEKTLIIRHNGMQLYHEIPEPDISAILEDYRLRADRQQIAWAYVEVGSKTPRSVTGRR